jgi:hypothetical protein
MTSRKGVKPATEATVNGLQEDDRLGGAINSEPSPISDNSQAFGHHSRPAAAWNDQSLPDNWRSLGEILSNVFAKLAQEEAA